MVRSVAPGAACPVCTVPLYPVTLQNRLYSGTEAKESPTIPAATVAMVKPARLLRRLIAAARISSMAVICP